jgi:hypothetical protein
MSGPYSWVLLSPLSCPSPTSTSSTIRHLGTERERVTCGQVPPSYFTLDDGRYNVGGGWGFLTEGGPGESPMSLELLQV